MESQDDHRWCVYCIQKDYLWCGGHRHFIVEIWGCNFVDDYFFVNLGPPAKENDSPVVS